MRRKSFTIGAFKFSRTSSSSVRPSGEPSSSTQPTRLPTDPTQPRQLPPKPLQSPHPSSTTSHQHPRNPAPSATAPQTPLPTSSPKHPPPSMPPPSSKRRKKNPPFSPVPKLDPNLPDDHHRLHHLLRLCLSHEFSKPKYASLSPDDRLRLDASVKKVLDTFATHSSTPDSTSQDKFRPNPANIQLKQRESQLTAICELYEKELDEWQKVTECAESDPISATPIAEPEDENVVPTDQQKRIDDVLAKSTRAVEAYILNTDHMRTMVKQLEARNKDSTSRIRNMAAKLNHRVLGEFGVADQQTRGLMPPTGLKKVETDDLNVAAMASES